MPLPPCQEATSWVMASLGFPPATLQKVRDKMHGESCLAALGLSRYRLEMAAEMHTSTWFDVDGCAGHALTARGSRAGDPWGDFLFNVVALA
eukprot:10181549-Lingulodinium_polyedra.AAC.1